MFWQATHPQVLQLLPQAGSARLEGSRHALTCHPLWHLRTSGAGPVSQSNLSSATADDINTIVTGGSLESLES